MRRTLPVFVGQPQEIIGKEIRFPSANTARRINAAAEAWVVWSPSEVEVLAAHVEIECLVEPLVTDVSAKLEVMPAKGFAEIVRPLIGVADLWQFPFEVVPNVEAPGDVDERYAFTIRAKLWVDARVGEIRIRAGKAVA